MPGFKWNFVSRVKVKRQIVGVLRHVDGPAIVLFQAQIRRDKASRLGFQSTNIIQKLRCNNILTIKFYAFYCSDTLFVPSTHLFHECLIQISGTQCCARLFAICLRL